MKVLLLVAAAAVSSSVHLPQSSSAISSILPHKVTHSNAIEVQVLGARDGALVKFVQSARCEGAANIGRQGGMVSNGKVVVSLSPGEYRVCHSPPDQRGDRDRDFQLQAGATLSVAAGIIAEDKDMHEEESDASIASRAIVDMIRHNTKNQIAMQSLSGLPGPTTATATAPAPALAPAPAPAPGPTSEIAIVAATNQTSTPAASVTATVPVIAEKSHLIPAMQAELQMQPPEVTDMNECLAGTLNKAMSFLELSMSNNSMVVSPQVAAVGQATEINLNGVADGDIIKFVKGENCQGASADPASAYNKNGGVVALGAVSVALDEGGPYSVCHASRASYGKNDADFSPVQGAVLNLVAATGKGPLRCLEIRWSAPSFVGGDLILLNTELLMSKDNEKDYGILFTGKQYAYRMALGDGPARYRFKVRSQTQLGYGPSSKETVWQQP